MSHMGMLLKTRLSLRTKCGNLMKNEKYGCVIASLRGTPMKDEKYGCVIASLRGNPIGRIVIANGMKQSLKKNT